MKFPRLFPDVPEDLAALGDAELSETLDAFRDVSKALRNAEIDLAETFGSDVSEDERTVEAMRQWTEAAEVVQQIRALQASRVEAVEAFDAEAATLDAVFADGEPEVEASEEADADAPDGEVVAEADTELTAETDDDDEDEGDAEGEPEAAADVEAVTASGAAARRPVRFPAVPRSHEARDSGGGNPVSLVAAAGLSNARVRAGVPLTSSEYAQAVLDVARSRGKVTRTQNGSEERILVASADFRYPDERTLKAGDPDGNAAKLRQTGSYFLGERARDLLVESLQASGGACAPPTPIYTLPDWETTERPVRDVLPAFNADRGGVSVPAVHTIGDITTAIDVIEESEDALGGTFSTKSSQAIDCVDWTDTFVGSISHIRTVGNLNARTWPEGVAKENSLTMAALARTADGRLLDKIDALSRHTTGAAVYGFASTLVYRLQQARVGIISRLRLPANTRFNVLLPFYAAEMFSLDVLNNSEEGRFDLPQDAIGALLSRYGFNVTWHLDEGIAGGATGEVFETQGTGALVDWPGTTIIARLFPAGMFIRVDGGSLELGVVRDSTLNETNDYSLFGEIWENVARIGPAEAAQRIAITACPDGTGAPFASSAFACLAS